VGLSPWMAGGAWDVDRVSRCLPGEGPRGAGACPAVEGGCPPRALRARRGVMVRRIVNCRRSLRAIAKEEGVSQTQVKRDLESPVTPVTPAPVIITGQDGKQYAATRPKPSPPEPVIDPARLVVLREGSVAGRDHRVAGLLPPRGGVMCPSGREGSSRVALPQRRA
jgi:hypothetical protein